MTKHPPKPPTRKMTAAELDAALKRIRASLDKIVERERGKG